MAKGIHAHQKTNIYIYNFYDGSFLSKQISLRLIKPWKGSNYVWTQISGYCPLHQKLQHLFQTVIKMDDPQDFYTVSIYFNKETFKLGIKFFYVSYTYIYNNLHKNTIYPSKSGKM